MWWDKVIFGMDSYQVVWWFLTYSILGWAVESLYMSFCNRKLTNRGFAKGPFCPIYGVGALTVYFLLRRYESNTLLLFIYGSVLATTLEFLTALLMFGFLEISGGIIKKNRSITKEFSVWRVQLPGDSIQYFYLDFCKKWSFLS